MNLTGRNLSYFENAVGFQNDAINSMKNGHDHFATSVIDKTDNS